MTRYVNNVTRHKRRLDWVLQQLCHRKLAKMDPLLHQLLRLGEEHIGLPFSELTFQPHMVL